MSDFPLNRPSFIICNIEVPSAPYQRIGQTDIERKVDDADSKGKGTVRNIRIVSQVQLLRS